MLRIVSTVVVIFFSVTLTLAQESGTVSANTAKLRGSPNLKGIVITSVRKHDTFEIIAIRGGWYLIQTPKYVGWINGYEINPGTALELMNDRRGDPNGRFRSYSDGPGSGSGQGGGYGTGQGSGRGTGTGIGSGQASGVGTGNANGSGTGGDLPQVPLKILSKPRPLYTDAARQANVQGTVILRVTFLASGQIGRIMAVKGLPNGLTEQAVAAARRITFEPAKRDGVPQTVTRQLEFPFTIY
ncbi:MAG: TonB family protein [Pyrinomonadaceae bacterium]